MSDSTDSQQAVERVVVVEDLHRLLREADRIVVTNGPFQNAIKFYESHDKADVAALAGALSIEEPENYSHCMCAGHPAIYVYKADTLLVQLTNHHGRSIRCSLWDSDVPVVDLEKWLSWFDARKITDPRREAERLSAQSEKSRRDLEKWCAAIPAGLETLWKESVDAFGQIDTSRFQASLDATFPVQRDQIRALLAWFGSGTGPWSGFPAYESSVEAMLMQHATADIVSAIDNQSLSSSQLEGAARFFCGWTFSRKRKDALHELPKALRVRLWDHVKDTEDADKLARARRAFN